jgi:hypothetical protein
MPYCPKCGGIMEATFSKRASQRGRVITPRQATTLHYYRCTNLHCTTKRKQLIVRNHDAGLLKALRQKAEEYRSQNEDEKRRYEDAKSKFNNNQYYENRNYRYSTKRIGWIIFWIILAIIAIVKRMNY